jgi:hypothetical protein
VISAKPLRTSPLSPNRTGVAEDIPYANDARRPRIGHFFVGIYKAAENISRFPALPQQKPGVTGGIHYAHDSTAKLTDQLLKYLNAHAPSLLASISK